MASATFAPGYSGGAAPDLHRNSLFDPPTTDHRHGAVYRPKSLSQENSAPCTLAHRPRRSIRHRSLLSDLSVREKIVMLPARAIRSHLSPSPDRSGKLAPARAITLQPASSGSCALARSGSCAPETRRQTSLVDAGGRSQAGRPGHESNAATNAVSARPLFGRPRFGARSAPPGSETIVFLSICRASARIGYFPR